MASRLDASPTIDGPPIDGRPIDGPPIDATIDAPAGPKIALEWGGPGAMGTGSRFRVDETGAVTDEFFDIKGSSKRVGRVTAAQLRAVAAVLVSHRLCALKADPNYVQVPEEYTTTLTVDLPGVACSIQLHTNEWGRASADSKAIETAISALMTKAKLK